MSTQSGQYCKRKETGLNFRIFFSLLWQLETESTKKICSGSNQPSSVTALSILKTVRLRLWPKKNCSALASPNSSAPALVPAKTARLRRWYQQKNSSALALASQYSSAPALVSAKTYSSAPALHCLKSIDGFAACDWWCYCKLYVT